jgi:dihydroxyacetone kinase DhaKLM complex PTS-EIIA-like component DhaM
MAANGGGRVAKHPFLSDPWLTEARKIYDEYKGKAPAPSQAVKMNQVITDVPFGEGTINAHIDTSSGELAMDTGHLDVADVKVTLDYATAKAVLVDGNMQAAMQAFMAGKIKAEGDITKLMALQTSGVGAADPVTAEIGHRIQEITE